MSKQQRQNPYTAGASTAANFGPHALPNRTRWLGVLATIALFSAFMATIQVFPFGELERWAAGLAIGLLLALSRFLLSGSKPFVYGSLAFLIVLYVCMALPIVTRLDTVLAPRFGVAFVLALGAVVYGDFVVNRFRTSALVEE